MPDVCISLIGNTGLRNHWLLYIQGISVSLYIHGWTAYKPPVSYITPNDFNPFSNLLQINQENGDKGLNLITFSIHQTTKETEIHFTETIEPGLGCDCIKSQFYRPTFCKVVKTGQLYKVLLCGCYSTFLKNIRYRQCSF